MTPTGFLSSGTKAFVQNKNGSSVSPSQKITVNPILKNVGYKPFDRNRYTGPLPFDLSSKKSSTSFASHVDRFRLRDSPPPTDFDDASSNDSMPSTPTRQLRPRTPNADFSYAAYTGVESDSGDEDEHGNEDVEENKDQEEDEMDIDIPQTRNKKKKRRIMDSDDDDDDDDDDDMDDDGDKSYIDQEEKDKGWKNIMPAKDNVAILQDHFPTASRSVIQQTLDAWSNSIALATRHLQRKNYKQVEPVVTAQFNQLTPKGRLMQRPLVQRSAAEEYDDSSEDSESESEKMNAKEALDATLEARRSMAKTIRFYNNATSQDIQDVTGCSPELAENLINNLRPFVGEEDLRTKLKKTKGLSEKFINYYMDMQNGYQAVDMIIEEIERLGGNLTRILDVWQGVQKENESAESSRQATPVSEMESDAPDETAGVHLVKAESSTIDKDSKLYRDAMFGFLTKQPDCVNNEMTLNNYQLVGVNWMLLLYRKGISGILADEMGLGKTAQIISFLGRLLELGEPGPHLIVVPSSTISNWLREFERFCPGLEVRAYHGSQLERFEMRMDMLEAADFNVVVTTYNIAAGHKDDRHFLRKLRCKAMILDEGHMVKNCTSVRYTNLMSLRTPFRLLVTGTPLQNNLQELVSLLTFIMPQMFQNYEEDLQKIFKFKAANTNQSKDASVGRQSVAQLLSRERIARAKKMMTPFVLRRRKADVLSCLPQKIQVVEQCPMTTSQQELYNRILQESKKTYEESLDTNKKKRKKSETTAQFHNVQNIVIHLRKAADHPLLFRNLYTDEKLKKMSKVIMKEEQYWDANVDYIYEDMSFMSDFELNRLCLEHKSIYDYRLNNEEWMDAGKVQKLKSLLPETIKKGNKVLLFSQFTKVLDILEVVMKTLDVRFVRLDGETKVSERQSIIDEYNENDEISVFLLSTKAGGFGINLTSANVVILYDIDFNPQNDKQAEDRAHRVGQTRDVTVFRLISDHTIEEHMYKMAQIKLRLDHSISGVGEEAQDEEEEKESMRSILKTALFSAP
ncbi:hypothetical protein DFQ28_009825 [Apophysomyces sp. BC1034]|nr:hypothetical protein DFQ30_009403 [Apophysomyces sp. BC1015]KAG0181725.1 hypothetical protein DFQ29_007270 [Apophysomyces sp. BC1021]KAG0185187.1 hypothetical protein DFQ28_009825 [Apophysomyces sp. BC1034]